MSTIDQNRMLKLAGLLKEGMEEWPKSALEEVEESQTRYGSKEPSSRDDYEQEECEECGGTGEDEEGKECLRCDGTGHVTHVMIPDHDLDEAAPPPHKPEDRKAAGMSPLSAKDDDDRGPFGEPLSPGSKIPASAQNPMNPVVENLLRSLIREALLEKAKTYKGKSMRLGGGGRFAKFVDSLKKSGKSEEQARAIAYGAGVKKYGKEKMKKMAAAGKKREAKKED